MNWDNLDWDNFSCVDMSRRIKDELDAKFATMSGDEIVAYLKDTSMRFKESLQEKHSLV
jgi:hypothetical protein